MSEALAKPSEMVERVKAALRDNIQAALPDGVTVDYDYAARAAIEAMREPTPEMSTAGKHAVKGCESTFERDIAESAYRAMIDAALSTGERG
jgi:hypothetical protein